MKHFLAVAAMLTFGPLGASAQSVPAKAAREQTAAQQKPVAYKEGSPAGAEKIDPKKEADIRRLLEIAGTKALVIQNMDAMTRSIKPLLTSSLPSGEYREKLVELFFAKFSSKADTQHLLDLAVPIYDKNFSDQEIRGLIEFYQTPLGQKAISTLPKLSAEMQEEGRKWGEALGRDTMMEVLAEHPELAEAIAAAQKNAAATNK